jgi:hypothetical protein
MDKATLSLYFTLSQYYKNILMKKILLLTTLFTTSILCYSQITITENNVIDVSDVLEQGIDTSGTFIHPSSGINMEWNFSSLNEHLSDVLALGAAQWFSGYSDFPNANIATVDTDGNELFIRKNSDGLDFLGAYGDLFDTGSNESIIFNPQNRVISFPSTMGTNFTNSFSFSVVNYSIPNTDSVLIDITTDQDSEIDGWGELTTPFGTFEVIRQVVEEVQTTNIEAYLFGTVIFSDESKDTAYTARYWSNDPSTGFPLVEYNYDMMSNTISEEITWLKSEPVTSLDEITANSFSLYPNPAVDETTLSGVDKGQKVVIYDVLGNVLLKNDIHGDLETIDLSNLKRGTYFVQINSMNGEILTRTKLVKQ